MMFDVYYGAKLVSTLTNESIVNTCNVLQSGLSEDARKFGVIYFLLNVNAHGMLHCFVTLC